MYFDIQVVKNKEEAEAGWSSSSPRRSTDNRRQPMTARNKGLEYM